MVFYNKSNIYRNLIIGADSEIPLPNGNMVTAINFDNAATTPPLKAVMEAVNEFMPWYSSIHRGVGYKSSLTTNLYDTSRQIIGDFVHADLEKDVVIYVKNTTEALNKLANRLCNHNHKFVVLSTDMEHHSNILPWKAKYNIDYISIDKDGQLSISDLEKKLIKYNGKVKLVTITGASNVTGIKNPIHEIAALCHKHNARIVVDCAQLAPHCKINMMPFKHKEHIDFIAFSSHKLYSPFGIGVLIGPKSDFEKGAPDYSGGGTVKFVSQNFVSWESPPSKEEAGTPNVIGVLALTAAINVLNEIDMNKLEAYEAILTNYTMMRLNEIPDIILYGATDSKRIGIIPFNIKGMEHETVAKALAYESGISVRYGCFCANPYVQKLLKISKKNISYYSKHPNSKKPGMVRLSFGMYNTIDEIDILIDSLKEISNNKDYYNKKYR